MVPMCAIFLRGVFICHFDYKFSIPYFVSEQCTFSQIIYVINKVEKYLYLLLLFTIEDNH